jgi:predicted ArsR family transcriptional regulator
MVPGPRLGNPGSVAGVDRLGVFKALADDTRYAVYREVAGASAPVGTLELARRLGLHPNTLRPHLERLRGAGLVAMSADRHGQVGRPEHRWSVAAGAPSLGLEPSGFRLLAQLLADAAARGGVSEVELREIGAGRTREAAPAGGARACLRSLVDQMASLGFDPSLEGNGRQVSVAFARCPFRELATAFPDLVCQLHRGLTEGMVEGEAVTVESFATLLDADPCRVSLALG